MLQGSGWLRTMTGNPRFHLHSLVQPHFLKCSDTVQNVIQCFNKDGTVETKAGNHLVEPLCESLCWQIVQQFNKNVSQYKIKLVEFIFYST